MTCIPGPDAAGAIGLNGTGGFAREVMPYLQSWCAGHREYARSRLCFVERQVSAAVVNGVPVMAESDFLALPQVPKQFNIAIADSAIRQRVADRFLAAGCTPLEIRAPLAEIIGPQQIGEGAILCSFAIVGPNVRIGRFFHLNFYSYVAHDCVIGDFVTFAPKVQCSGNVVIGDHAFVGAGAVIRQGTPDRPLTIGRGAVIGMGAVVTKDVPPYAVMIGNPARPLGPAR